MSLCAWSPGEGVETFQIGSSQVMFHPDFIQAVTGETLHGGDFALIFLNRWIEIQQDHLRITLA